MDLETPNSGSLESIIETKRYEGTNPSSEIPLEYMRTLMETMDNMKGIEKYTFELERSLYGNPKGGTGKFMSQEKRNKAKKKRKRKSN
jgi:hypothetical protein